MQFIMPSIINNVVSEEYSDISPSKSNHNKSFQNQMQSTPQKFVSKIPRVKSRGSSKSPGGYRSMRETSNSRIPTLKGQRSEAELILKSGSKCNFQHNESKGEALQKSTGRRHHTSFIQKSIDRKSNCSFIQKSNDRVGKRMKRSPSKGSPLKESPLKVMNGQRKKDQLKLTIE
jgi:hypothetical protein